jgi:hypothetical protein
MLNLVTSIATSPLKQSAAMRWTWRPRRLPALSEMYQVLRDEMGGGPVLPLAHNTARKKTAAVLVPNASFGGAEKVAYAAGRELKNQGFETHLFVLGNERINGQAAFGRHTHGLLSACGGRNRLPQASGPTLCGDCF